MITRTAPSVGRLVKNISWFLADYDDDKLGYASLEYRDGVLTLAFDADFDFDNSPEHAGDELTGWKSISYHFKLVEDPE